MKQNIAKVYVKALQSISDELVVESYDVFKDLNLAYKDENLRDFISSITATKAQKLALIKELANSKNSSINTLLEILSQNNRFTIIPQLFEELRYMSAIINNSYEGVVSSKDGISDKVVLEFSDKLSKKLSKDIKFEQKNIKDELVRVSIEDLDVEMSFSKEQFKAQMSEHILKAI